MTRNQALPDGELLHWQQLAVELAAADDPRSVMLGDLLAQLYAAIARRDALAQVLATARRADGALGDAADELRGASVWAWVDVVSGWWSGWWPDLFKYHRLAGGHDDLGRARFLLGRLRAQLAMLPAESSPPDGRSSPAAQRSGPVDHGESVPANPHGPQLGGGWRAADRWLDCPAVDSLVGLEVWRSRAEVDRTRRSLNEPIERLARRQAEAGWQVHSLQEGIRELTRPGRSAVP